MQTHTHWNMEEVRLRWGVALQSLHIPPRTRCCGPKKMHAEPAGRPHPHARTLPIMSCLQDCSLIDPVPPPCCPPPPPPAEVLRGEAAEGTSQRAWMAAAVPRRSSTQRNGRPPGNGSKTRSSESGCRGLQPASQRRFTRQLIKINRDGVFKGTSPVLWSLLRVQ